VNDYAGLLSAADRDSLESLLAERERATGAQVVVAIFPSLDGESLEDYSIRLAERWRVGQKGLDNGVILLVFVAERRVRMEVGYGLEPVIPDAVAGRIIAEVVAPQFRQGRFATGLEAAARAVYDRIGSQGGASGRRARGPDPATLAVLFLFAVIAGFVVLSQLGSARRLARRSGYTAGYGGWSTPTGVYRGGWGGGWSSRGGGDFSGGGGRFGGGGASGSW
jgi:uncharacterized protein